jgi:tetratricopeptide (TPR) repeat protein/tRNA A-37 threonylcarbamoyl transferase component Bud32
MPEQPLPETVHENRSDASLDAGLAAAFGPDSQATPPTRCETPTSSAAKGDTPPQSSPQVEPATAFPTAGRYLLESEIARGGMGVVYRGHDPALDRRAVAVKVLTEDGYRRPELAQRFVEEAQIAAKLQHPCIVPVHDVGTCADGRPFLVMKLVKGDTLAALLAERRDATADLSRFLGIFEQICQTLAYAHARKVLHRDLKPSNVMVGAHGEVQIMDWGLAKVLPREATGEEPMTRPVGTEIRTGPSDGLRAGSFAGMGTPGYAPPEQVNGEVWRVDERVDVFGLGALLCAILTGRPPYVAADRREVVGKAMRGDVTEAFARLESCGADAELVQLCKDCLAPAVRDRPRDGSVVKQRVVAYQEGVRERLRQAELERAAAQARAVEERKRRRVLLALATAALALVGTGAGSALWLQSKEADRREAVARRETELRQGVEADLQTAATLRDQARWATARQVLTRTRERLGATGPADLRERLEQAAADLELAARLDDIRLKQSILIEGKLDIRTADKDFAAAFRDTGLGREGEDVEAVAARIRASAIKAQLVAALDDWALTRACLTKDPEQSAWLLRVARRADADDWRDRFRDPKVWQDRAALEGLANELLQNPAKLQAHSPQLLVALGVALWSREGNAVPLLTEARRRSPSDFWLNFELGQALCGAEKWEEAAGYYRAALAVRPETPVVYNNLGSALADDKQLDAAIAEYQKAIDLDPKFAPAHYNLGVALYAKKQLDAAIEEYQKAIEIDPKYAKAHYNLGNALYERKQLDAAIEEYQKAIEIDPKYAKAHNNLGGALADKGQLDAAIEECQKAIALDPKLPQAHYNLGNALYAKKQVDAAIEEYQKAIDLDPKDAMAHGALGQALLAHGRFAEAREATGRCLQLLPEGHPLRKLVTQQLQQCERLLALEEKLPAILEGKAKPEDAERLALAQLCQMHKKHYAAAARFYAEAFEDKPDLAKNLRNALRYNAACAAALAGCGQGKDADKLEEKERARLRQQALDWLKADLALWEKVADNNNPKARDAVQQKMKHWQGDADLVGVREKDALEKLPEAERDDWRKFWDDVASVLKKVEEPK